MNKSKHLEISSLALRDNYDRRPFLIDHNLSNHPLFKLERLIQLSKCLPQEHIRYNSGDVQVKSGYDWINKPTLFKELPVQDIMKNIEAGKSWLVLKYVEQDPEYQALVNDCLGEVASFTDPMDARMSHKEGFIFVTSPGMVTPFHFDPEKNFLLQIQGTKTIHLWDPLDRTVVAEHQLEDFFSAHQFIERSDNIRYSSELEAKSSVFEIHPGLGLFFPFLAPHWVKNHNQVSISFSITYQSPIIRNHGHVYQVNKKLRGLGMDPTPPGSSPVKDFLKVSTYKCFRTLKRMIRH